MPHASVEERLRQLMSTELGLPAEQIVPAANLVEDLGLDSLDAMKIVVAVEKEFDISIEDDNVLARLTTVAAVLQLIEDTLSTRTQ